MTTIDIDFDVFKALTAKRSTEGMTYNDVLRDLLGLGRPKASALAVATSASPSDWVTKGVRFPSGTEFRGAHKGRTHVAVVESGALVLNGKRFDTPSSAANFITGTSVNGWIFWECRLPGKSNWQLITTLRKGG